MLDFFEFTFASLPFLFRPIHIFVGMEFQAERFVAFLNVFLWRTSSDPKNLIGAPVAATGSPNATHRRKREENNDQEDPSATTTARHDDTN